MTNRFVCRLSQIIIVAGALTIGLSACDAPEDTGSTAVGDDSQATWTVVSDTTYGGIEADYFEDILPLPDGGFIAAGSSATHEKNKGDGWVIRADADGAVRWEKFFDGGGGDIDILYRILPLPNGDVVAAGLGYRGMSAGASDFWAIRLDGDGEVIWERFFGEGDRTDQDLNDAIVLSDGRLVLVGTVELDGWMKRDCLVVVMDPDGNTLWTKTVGGGDMNRSLFLREIESGGVELWVHTEDSSDTDDYSEWVIRFDRDGNQILREDRPKLFKGDIFDIEPLSNGDHIAVGYVEVPDESSTVGWKWVPTALRLDENLNQIWQKLYELEEGHQLSEVLPLGDDRYLVVGTMTGTIPVESGEYTFHLDDLRIMEIDGDGEVSTELRLGGKGSERVNGLKKMQNGDVLLVGQTNSKGSGMHDGQVIRLQK